MSGTTQRSPEDIRRDIEQHRRELGEAVDRLRGDVKRATDWRAQIVRNQQKVLIGAAVAGFVIGGGIAVIPRIFGRGK
ncbi:MAG TPA: DUF3618 domain-containing protein [Solirubrobacteraceae bacterium]